MDLRGLRPIDADVARDRALRRWRDGFADVTPIADVTDRQPATCVGVVSAIRLVPGRSIEVTVEDGSGRLVAAWSGRTSLRGVELGGALRMTGCVGIGPEGVRRIRNPAWMPVAEPEA